MEACERQGGGGLGSAPVDGPLLEPVAAHTGAAPASRPSALRHWPGTRHVHTLRSSDELGETAAESLEPRMSQGLLSGGSFPPCGPPSSPTRLLAPRNPAVVSAAHSQVLVLIHRLTLLPSQDTSPRLGPLDPMNRRAGDSTQHSSHRMDSARLFCRTFQRG